jgi:2,4-dichlorophenol 6-monooxygenase
MYPWVANSPRAHILNQRAAEVFRDLGVEQQVLNAATPWASMGDSVLSTSLAGPELLRIRAWGTGDERHGDYGLFGYGRGVIVLWYPGRGTGVLPV